MRFLVFSILSFLLLSCSDEEYTAISGKTMGTYYSIQYKSQENFTVEIDSILKRFISAASTYDSLSEISEFNRTGTLTFRSPHLYNMLVKAREIHTMTAGAFEPTLMPLIRAHGFNTSERMELSNRLIDSLRALVSFSYIAFDSLNVKALKPGVQLDLNAIGEGFAIELLVDFLEKKEITDYKVEIGGEMKCKGKNSRNEYWLIGVENPFLSGKKTLANVRLRNEAISTSGVSRKFYLDKTGKKRSHLIDPKTGNSIDNDLLSVTIRNGDAVKADALATACMVMGRSDAVSFAKQYNLNALIVFEEDGKVHTWMSDNFEAD